MLLEQFQNLIEKPSKQNRYPKTHIYHHWLPWLGTGTSIKCGGVVLVLWTNNQ